MSRKGLPLRLTLLTGVTVLILLAAGSVGGYSYYSSSRAVGAMWKLAAHEAGGRVAQRVLRFLEPAVPYLNLTVKQAEQGRLDPHDQLATLEYLKAALLANPSFTWATFGGADGVYLAAFRTREGGLQATIREAEQGSPDAQGKRAPRWRDLAWQPDGSLKVLRDSPDPYDPRTRSWYQAALKAGKAVWMEPFLFSSRQQPGFSCVAPLLAADGKPRGVFAVEFETENLSEFLSNLSLSAHGKVYLITSGGLVLGHPGAQLTEKVDGKIGIARAETHPDRFLREAWLKYQERKEERKGGEQSFPVKDLLGMAQPFPPETGIDWVALGVAPSDDFFGQSLERRNWAVGIAIVILVLSALLGAGLATRVTEPLQLIGAELDKVGRFELTDKRVLARPSEVREVNKMAGAVDRMKASLRSFARYVPTQLVQDLLASGEEARLGGHKQELTTLFSDLEGFTTLSEQMEPDELVEALGDYFAGMSDVIRTGHGTVDKFIGDAIMAFWGAPRKLEQHALFACRAALGMRARMRTIQADWRKAGRPVISARIGINTGVSLVGNIGSPERMNYTAMGDTVNLASRLEGLNKAYGTRILLGETTAAAVEHELVVRPIDWVAVKGRARAVLVHELVGERGRVPPEVEKACALSRDALEAYRNRRFAEAAALFDKVGGMLSGSPVEEPTSGGAAHHDAAAMLLANRCRAYLQKPPPADWSGAHVMMEK